MQMVLPLFLIGAAACKAGGAAAATKAASVAVGAKCGTGAASTKSAGEELFHAADMVHELGELAESGSNKRRK